MTYFSNCFLENDKMTVDLHDTRMRALQPGVMYFEELLLGTYEVKYKIRSLPESCYSYYSKRGMWTINKGVSEVSKYKDPCTIIEKKHAYVLMVLKPYITKRLRDGLVFEEEIDKVKFSIYSEFYKGFKRIRELYNKEHKKVKFNDIQTILDIIFPSEVSNNIMSFRYGVRNLVKVRYRNFIDPKSAKCLNSKKNKLKAVGQEAP